MDALRIGYSRRRFLEMLGTGAAGTAAALLGCRPTVESSGADAPRLILLVTCDTTRRDNLQIYGYPLPTCPQLAEIARPGFIFRNAFTTANDTQTTHSVILSGLYSFLNRSYRNGQRWALPKGHRTLAERVSEHGYTTVAATSMASLRPNMVGNGSEHFFHTSSHSRPAHETHAELLGPLSALLGSRDSRVFLWVHYWDPHEPYAGPANFDAPFRLADYQNPVPGQYEYDREIAYMDAHIGRLVQFLRERGVWDDTALVLTNDHGEHFGEVEGLPLESHYSLYDFIVRSPLVLAGGWFERLRRQLAAPGIQSALVSSSQAIMPTILDAIGVEQPEAGLSGRSLLPSLGAAPDRNAFVFGESDTAMQTFVRTERYKLIAWNLEKFDTDLERLRRGEKNVYITARVLDAIRDRKNQEGLELYDLRADPGERRNVAAEEPLVVARLMQTMHTVKTAGGFDVRPDNQPSDAMLDQLRQLGYVE